MISNGAVGFGTPCHHLPVLSTVGRGANCSLGNGDRSRVHAVYGSLGLRVSRAVNGNGLVSRVFNRFYRNAFVRPAFVVSCPIRVDPLAGVRQDGPKLARHFRLVVGNGRITGTCDRLGSPVSRRRHFGRRLHLDRGKSSRTVFVSRSFLHTLRFNVPPASNVNVNVSHLIVLVANRAAVRRILLFPRVHPRGAIGGSATSGCITLNVSRT